MWYQNKRQYLLPFHHKAHVERTRGHRQTDRQNYDPQYRAASRGKKTHLLFCEPDRSTTSRGISVIDKLLALDVCDIKTMSLCLSKRDRYLSCISISISNLY